MTYTWAVRPPRRPRRPPPTTVDSQGNVWVIPADAARAVGRFQPGGPIGYRSSRCSDAPLRRTRAEAVADWCATLPTA